jgi:hypothetical protein
MAEVAGGERPFVTAYCLLGESQNCRPEAFIGRNAGFDREIRLDANASCFAEALAALG